MIKHRAISIDTLLTLLTNAERQRAYRERQRNAGVTPTVTEPVTNVTNVTDVTPSVTLSDEAVTRAARAKRYGAKFPHLIRKGDEVFQEPAWQQQHV